MKCAILWLLEFCVGYPLFNHHSLQCDILNPLVTVHREKHNWPGANFKPFSRCVFFRGNLYVGGMNYTTYHGEARNVLLRFSSDLASCSPTYVQKELFGLAKYNSQLVLIGGRDKDSRKMCERLLTSEDGLKWEEGVLPPITAPRLTPLAVSIGSPECLLVVGGLLRNSVEVLKEGQWSTVEPFPHHTTSCYSTLRSAIHNGKLYFHTGNFESDNIFFCNLNTLLNPPSPKDGSELWKVMKMPCDNFCLVSFRGQLIAFSLSYGVYAYVPYTNSWVYVGSLGKLPAERLWDRPTCLAVFLHTGNMFMFLLREHTEVSKVSLKGEMYIQAVFYLLG